MNSLSLISTSMVRKISFVSILVFYILITTQVIQKINENKEKLPCQPKKELNPKSLKILDLEDNEKLFYVNDKLPVDQILHRDFIPTTVFYVWCGDRWFEFPHYLSVMSVMKHLRPDNFIFYFDKYPVMDNWIYNTWFKELREEFPFIRPQKLKIEDGACEGLAKPNLNFIKKTINYLGAIYVHEMTIITKLPERAKAYDLVDGLNINTGFMMAKKEIFEDNLEEKQNIKKKTIECIHVNNFKSRFVKKANCIYQTDALFPKDIWYLNNSFGELARSLLFGNPKIKYPKTSKDNLAPNIAHIVWLGGGEMDFLFFLGVLSLLNVAKVDALYIHGDGPPTGYYWEIVKNHERLHLIHREHPGSVYGTQVNVLSHVTDIWRVDFMIKYGGIYVDTDVVFVKPLDERIRSYDAVATYDWTYWNHPFPDTINFGVSLGKRNAEYWHKFQESMKWFIDSDWSWNGLRRPYKIQERHPDLIKIDPHFSVICFRALCHPTWWPNYHNESIHHLNSPSIKNWKKDVYAFHWTLPTPFELINHTNLLKSSSMFSEIGLYVLEKSNLLKYFKNL